MTREEQERVDYQIEVMKAYQKGAVIEYIDKEDSDDFWGITGNPQWNWRDFNYRIKKQPKYRSYKNAQEFLQAQKEHGMYLYMNKEREEYVLPILVDKYGITVASIFNNTHVHGWRLLFEDFTWQDGTPCGIKE